jgi:hypothetical protein
VPSLFQDNFDYLDLRRDFLHGVLTSDLLMKNIYCYVARDGYAARVKDTKSYDSVTYVSFLLLPTKLIYCLAAETSYLAGHSLWYQMTTILAVISTSICVETSTLPKKASPLHGMCTIFPQIRVLTVFLQYERYRKQHIDRFCDNN